MSSDKAVRWTTLCGDPTCNSYGCSQEALDAFHERQEEDAREIVRAALGLPEPRPKLGGHLPALSGDWVERLEKAVTFCVRRMKQEDVFVPLSVRLVAEEIERR